MYKYPFESLISILLDLYLEQLAFYAMYCKVGRSSQVEKVERVSSFLVEGSAYTKAQRPARPRLMSFVCLDPV